MISWRFYAAAFVLAVASVPHFAAAQFFPLGVRPGVVSGGGGGGGAPALDTGNPNSIAGSQSVGAKNLNPCASGAGGGSGITTSAANEDIFIVGVHEVDPTQQASGPVPFISAMSGVLTWGKLLTPTAGHNAIISDADGIGGVTGMFQTLEIWWANAPTAGTYNPFMTIDGPATLDAGAYVCFAVSGAHATAPQDTNASIAATAAGASSAHPTVAGVSTTAANSMLIAIATSTSPTIDCPGLGSSAPAGFTQLVTRNVTTAAKNFLCMSVAYKQVSATQSSITVPWTNASTWPNWLSMVTALVSDSTVTSSCGSFTFNFTDPCNLIWAPL